MIQIHNKDIKSYKSKLKQYRVAKGLTQLDLSELSGVNIKSIASYEQQPDRINKATVESIKSLAECVGCTIEDLLER